MIRNWYEQNECLEQPARSAAYRDKQHDAIVVGAGPAGATAAYFMAREGLDVLLLDRAPFPGAKNCGGANVVGEHTHKLFPNFWDELEYERIIADQAYWWLTEDSVICLRFTSQKLAAAPYNRLTVRRPNLYRWLAGKAETAGACVQFGKCAECVLFDGKQAVGVRLSPPDASEHYANIIILADGVNSQLAQKAGLAPPLSPEAISLYAKETIALTPEVIEERFALLPGQGAIIGLIGYPTFGYNGTGSLHTFRDSLNINAGMAVARFAEGNIHPNELLERIKRHPAIEPLLAGGKTIEYGAAMIPEGGYYAIPPLVHPGLLIVGDAGSLVNGTNGINLAMWSGYYAAQAAVQAKRKGDFSQEKLSLYRELLADSFILKDLYSNRGLAKLQQDVPYLFDLYTKMANQYAYFSACGMTMPKTEKRKLMIRKLTAMQPVRKVLADAWKIIKAVR